MAANNVHASAGVYQNIKDLSGRANPDASTIAVFVGGAARGPVGERTLITDQEQFDSTFGKRHTKYGYAAYSVAPYLNQSPRGYFTRVVNGALTALAYLTVDDHGATKPSFSIVNREDPENPGTPQGIESPLDNLGFLATDPGVSNILGYFCLCNPGVWNNKVSVRVSPSAPSGIDPVNGRDLGLYTATHFWVEVYEDFDSNPVPQERFLVSRTQETNEEGTQMFIEDVLEGSNYIRFKNNEHCAEVSVVTEAFEFFAGGTDGDSPTSDQVAEAWELYGDPEIIDCNLLINCGYADHIVQRKMVEIAEGRNDCMAILDLPSDQQEVADAIAYRRNILNINSPYAAMYGSDVKVFDEHTAQSLYVPVSGFIAGAYAYTDSNRAQWFAPAGIERGQLSINGVRVHYGQGARDALDGAQINPVRKIPGQGFVIWGQSTMYNRASSRQYVNVMRLTFYILKALSREAIYSVFQPNDDILRSRLRNIADTFLVQIRQGRGIYEHSVVCDSRNNSAETIANGDVILDLIYDPVIAAKRVHVVFNINKKGSTSTTQ